MRRGEVFGVIGPSGSGKSTLLHSVNQLTRLSGGQVFVAGVDVTELPLRALRKIRHYVGMIVQHCNLFNC